MSHVEKLFHGVCGLKRKRLYPLVKMFLMKNKAFYFPWPKICKSKTLLSWKQVSQTFHTVKNELHSSFRFPLLYRWHQNKSQCQATWRCFFWKELEINVHQGGGHSSPQNIKKIKLFVHCTYIDLVECEVASHRVWFAWSRVLIDMIGDLLSIYSLWHRQVRIGTIGHM